MKNACFAIFLLLVTNNCFGQVLPAELRSHINTLDSFYQLTPLEKAYLHADKNWYLPGETIWFKGYVTVDNQLTELSRVIYVDLVNARDSVVIKSMWKLNGNTCRGDLTLPAAMVAGTYKLRIYTLWMLNTPEVIDEKIISVLSPTPALLHADEKTDPATRYRVQLFPEGGSLVHGLKSNVAFKISDSRGLPVDDAVLTLEDGEGKILANTKPFHAGMGSFEWVPDSKEKYKVAVKINGVKYLPEIPPILPKGITLQVNALNENRIFYSIQKPAGTDNSFDQVIVIAHMNGQAVYSEKVNLEETVTGGAINKRLLPHGMVTVTVFNSNMVPLAERLVFVKKVNSLSAQITIEAKNIVPKGKNTVRLTLPSDSCRLSVAIASAGEAPAAFTNNTIASYFLLSGEIRGYVHEPWYYLLANDSAHNAALDLLMQTQGWRRFSWQSILSKELPPLQFFIETGISVRGIAKPRDTKGAPFTEAKVNIILKGEDSTTLMAETLVNETGKFAVNNLDFRKSAKLYLQGSKLNTTRTDALIDLLPNYIDTTRFVKNVKAVLSNADTSGSVMQRDLLRVFYDSRLATADGLTLGNVTVNAKVKTPEQKLNDQYVSDWYKTSDFTFAIDSTTGFSSIWQYLQGMVPGLNVSGDMFNPTVNFSRYSGGITDASLLSNTLYEDMNTVNGEVKSSIAFFLNEMPISIGFISNINPKDIALVKVNRTPNVIANATAGSMFIYTRKGTNYTGRSFDKQTLTGYHYAKEYFMPVYETPESKAVIDKRSSLYWNANLKTINKQAVIHFYNSDSVKKIKITVEGLDKNGIPIWAEKIVE